MLPRGIPRPALPENVAKIWQQFEPTHHPHVFPKSHHGEKWLAQFIIMPLIVETPTINLQCWLVSTT